MYTMLKDNNAIAAKMSLVSMECNLVLDHYNVKNVQFVIL